MKRSIKRLVTLVLLAAILTLTSCSGSGTNFPELEAEIQTIDFIDSHDLISMTIDQKDGSIYVADIENIYVYNYKSKEWNPVIKGLGLCRCIEVSKDNIFVFDENTMELKIFDKKGNLKKEHDLQDIYVNKIVHLGSNVFILDSMSVMVFDINSGESKKLEFDNVNSLTGYYKDSIIITQTTGNIIIYDINKMEIIKEPRLNIHPLDTCYIPEDKSLYYIEGSYLKKVNIDDNTRETMYVNSESSFKNIKAYNNKLIISDSYKNIIYIIDKNTSSKELKNNINITSLLSNTCDNDPVMMRAIEIHKQKYPDIRFKFQLISPNSPTFKSKLMAGDIDEIGIFYTNNINLSELVTHDIFYDLNNCPEIVGKFNLMFDGIKENLTYNDKIYGVPYMASADAWKVNTDLMNILKLEYLKEDWTWFDFYDYAKKARQDINGDGKPDTYIAEFRESYPYFLRQHQAVFLDPYNKTASYNTQELIDLLNLWKKLFKEDLVETVEFIPSEAKDNILFLADYMGLNTGVGNEAYICVPTLKSHRIYNNSIDYFMINKKSYNVETCIEFLKTYLSEDVQKINTNYGFFKDRSVYDLSNLNDPILLKSLQLTNEGNFELLNTIYKYSKPQVSIEEFGTYSAEIIGDFMSGKISAEEAAKLLDEKAKMIVGE